MPYSLILLDLDGTLVDSSPGIVHSLQHGLEQFKLSASKEELVPLIGPPAAEVFKTLHPDLFSDSEKLATALAAQRAYYAEKGFSDSVLYPGVLDLLSQLKTKKNKLFIATLKPLVFAKKLLCHHQIENYFEDIVGTDFNLVLHEKKQIIDKILLSFSMMNKKEVVMIGDRIYDIEAAKHHNIDSIGVTYGYGCMQEITDAKPTFIANNVNELFDLLN